MLLSLRQLDVCMCIVGVAIFRQVGYIIDSFAGFGVGVAWGWGWDRFDIGDNRARDGAVVLEVTTYISRLTSVWLHNTLHRSNIPT